MTRATLRHAALTLLASVAADPATSAFAQEPQRVLSLVTSTKP